MKNDGVGGDWKGDGEGNVLVTVVRDTAHSNSNKRLQQSFFSVLAQTAKPKRQDCRLNRLNV